VDLDDVDEINGKIAGNIGVFHFTGYTDFRFDKNKHALYSSQQSFIRLWVLGKLRASADHLAVQFGRAE